MKIGVVRERFPGERRVALVPASLVRLSKAGIEVLVETDAGLSAGFHDSQYVESGARIVDSAADLADCDGLVMVRAAGLDLENLPGRLDLLKSGKFVLATADPLSHPQPFQQIAETGASFLALEMIPRITRAQVMDVLSSMATIAGYRAVLLAATELPKIFPMMMTAAGTITAARVFVIGAGVAGLQAIATARRLGAIVQAYDVRPACREQVESLGGKFVELDLKSDQAEDEGGYAKALGDDFYLRQQQLMAEVVAHSDVVITTAAIPGKPSPLLITNSAVEGMASGSVIVDLAAERGGNCEPSQLDQRVEHAGVTILGPSNLPAEIPHHASQMFSNNVTKLLLHLIHDGSFQLDSGDAIVGETLVTHQGEIINTRIRELLELPALEQPVQSAESETIPLDDEDSPSESVTAPAAVESSQPVSPREESDTIPFDDEPISGSADEADPANQQ